VNTIEPPQQRNRRGCLFYALVVSGALVLLVLLALVSGYYGLRKAVNTITERAPVALPQVQVSDDETAMIKKKVDAFRENVRTHAPASPLKLTDREINALIVSSPEFKQLKDKVRVKIENGQLRGQISLPLAETGVGFLEGRYLNGTGTISVQLDGGRLTVSLADVQVNGKPLPATWMKRLSGINLAQKLNDDPDAAKALAALQGIEARDNTLVFTPKP